MNKLVIYYVAAKHFLWGLLILTTPFELRTATLTTIYSLFPLYKYAGAALFVGAILAFYATRLKNKPMSTSILFLSPLIFFVIIAAFNAINQVLLGRYADGVIRPWQFIFADQEHAILTMIILLVAVFAPLREVKYGK